MLETKFQVFEERIDAAAKTIDEFASELRQVRRYMEQLARYGKPVLWLISAILIHGTGGNVVKLSGLLLKSLGAAL